VYVTTPRHGLSSTVEPRSPATGRIVRTLATFGQSFTNNGLALSPTDSDVYVTLVGRRGLRIERIAVASRTRTFVADGEKPAVSPDGRLLAYAAGRFGSETLAVRDLASHRTRTIDLAGLLGRSRDLLDGVVTWLGDGSEIVVMPGPVAVAVAGSARTTPSSQGRSCDAVSASATCLIVVRVTAGGRPVIARRVILAGGANAAAKLSGDVALPRSLLLAREMARRTTIDRVTLTGSGANVTRLLSLPPVLPVTVDPRGHHFLCLVGHSPPALWIAGISRGRLVHPHRLMPNAQLDDAAW
jgi:hypothetical protein